MCVECSLRLVRIGLGIFYFILFYFLFVLLEFVLGLSLLLVNFVVEFVKFISDFRLIKFFIAFKNINNIVEGGQSANLLKQTAKINTYIY